MRICCLGDIHYYGQRSDLELLTQRIESVCGSADAMVVVGDLTSSGRLDHMREVLEAVRDAAGGILVLVVPGNHDIYVAWDEVERGVNSLLKLSIFNSLVENIGCIALMKKPFIIDNVGFVGSIGWYDYSFAPQWLNLPLDTYREKAFGLSIWADREFVKLPFSDEEFTITLLERFEEHIREVYSAVEKIVAVMHHVPFRELVHYKLIPEWDYFSTFMGSESFGHVIKKYDKVKLVLYGHSHNGVDTGFCKELHGIKCCSCASPIPLVTTL